MWSTYHGILDLTDVFFVQVDHIYTDEVAKANDTEKEGNEAEKAPSVPTGAKTTTATTKTTTKADEKQEQQQKDQESQSFFDKLNPFQDIFANLINFPKKAFSKFSSTLNV